jgi:HK97 gp10 family phage protein
MSSGVSISVTGVKEIDAFLKGLPLQFQDRILKAAHADAAKPLVSAAQSLAPLGKTGNLRRSIGVERISLKKTNEVGLVRVGPRRKSGYKGFHAHLIEYGKTNRDGSRTNPQPFMEPAFNQTKTIVEGGIATSIGKKLNAFIKRTLKK